MPKALVLFLFVDKRKDMKREKNEKKRKEKNVHMFERDVHLWGRLDEIIFERNFTCL